MLSLTSQSYPSLPSDSLVCVTELLLLLPTGRRPHELTACTEPQPAQPASLALSAPSRGSEQNTASQTASTFSALRGQACLLKIEAEIKVNSQQGNAYSETVTPNELVSGLTLCYHPTLTATTLVRHTGEQLFQSSPKPAAHSGRGPWAVDRLSTWAPEPRLMPASHPLPPTPTTKSLPSLVPFPLRPDLLVFLHGNQSSKINLRMRDHTSPLQAAWRPPPGYNGKFRVL